MKLINEVGNKYGRLTVLERDVNRGKRVLWKCQCDCGNITSVYGDHLRSGASQSCGCYHKERVIQSHLDRAENIINKKFGMLLVINEAGFMTHNNGQRSRIYNCLCDCGNSHLVRHYHLTSGRTVSCGCIKSKGEFQIARILQENNIDFKREYSFKDLKDKSLLRFDFAIFKDDKLLYLIEFQGEQHYDTSNGYYCEELIQHDKMKVDYCKKNNIPLKVINYKEIDNLTFINLLV